MAQPARQFNPDDDDSDVSSLSARERANQRWGMASPADPSDTVTDSTPPNLHVINGGGETTSPRRGHLSGADSAKELKNKEQEAEQPDRSDFSANDKIRETLGKGYTGKGSTKSRFLSRLYSSDSGLKKKIAIAGALAGGSIISGIFVLLALLPLKIDMLIENIDQTFGATTNNAMEKEADNLFSGWVKNALIPALNTKRCTRTVDPGCVPLKTGTGPIGQVYAAWRKNRLDEKLAQNGIVVGLDSLGRPVMYVQGSPVDLRPLRDGSKTLSELPGTKVMSIKERTQALNSAFKSETLWDRTYARFIKNNANKTLGSKVFCVFVCIPGTDKVQNAKISLKDRTQAFKIELVARVLGSRGTVGATLVACILTPENCSTNISFENSEEAAAAAGNDNSPRQSKSAQAANRLIEQYLDTATLNDFAKLAETGKDINHLGVNGYLEKMVAQQIAQAFGGDVAKKVTGQVVDKALPIFGWVSLATGVVAIAANGPAIIKSLAYVANSTAAAQTYVMFKTVAHERRSGNTDAAGYGSFDTALTAQSDVGTTHSDMTVTPAYNYYIENGSGSTGLANTASIFAADTSDGGAGTYVCDDSKPVPADQLACTDENLDSTDVAALDDLANSGNVKAIGGFAGVLNKITGFVGDPLGGIISNIPGIQQVMDAISSFASGFLDNLALKAIPNPFGDMSGGRTGDMAIAGGDVSNNAYCYQTIGCAKVSDATVAAARGEQLQEAKQQFDSEPMFARIFSTSTPYSLISRLALALPASPLTGAENFLTTITANPLQFIFSSMSDIFTTSTAFAAPKIVGDPFGVTQMGYNPSDIPSDPQAFWDANCSTPAPGNQYGYYDANTETFDASNWYANSEFQEQDQNTLQAVATKPNPCMLIIVTAQSTGVMFDASMIGSSS